MSRDNRHRFWEMIQIEAEINPWVPSSFPDRNRRRREGGIGERADRDTKMLTETIGLPIDCSAAFRTKIHLKFSALLTIPDVHFAGPLPTLYGAPVRRWHSWQWHAAMNVGSPVASTRNEPQQQ